MYELKMQMQSNSFQKVFCCLNICWNYCSCCVGQTQRHILLIFKAPFLLATFGHKSFIKVCAIKNVFIEFGGLTFVVSLFLGSADIGKGDHGLK